MFELSLKHWGGEDFVRYFERDFKRLNLEALPLAQFCTHSGVIDEQSISVRVLSSTAEPNFISLKIGVFFSEISSGCVCSDEPDLAIMADNSYGELAVRINRNSAKINFLD
jgi:hypothetical protein